jgi:Zn-dependent peptidase ImmA (M78 family)
MHLYEGLESEAAAEGIIVDYTELKTTRALLLRDGDLEVIQICPSASYAERACLLAEELGHHFTSVGNTVIHPDPTTLSRSEERALRFAVERLLPLDRVTVALSKAPRSLHELAEDLGVTVDLLRHAMAFWEATRGLYAKGDDCVLKFDPTGVYRTSDQDDFCHFLDGGEYVT